jgi:glycolate oxidase
MPEAEALEGDIPPRPASPDGSAPRASAELRADLAAAGEVIYDPAIIEGYRKDQAAPGMLQAGMPIAVVRPLETAEVQAAVQAAARHGIPIVPRGAGSGLSGGANAIDGCIVVSLERMNKIIAIDTGNMTATVQPGVINVDLRKEALRHGLWYAPDPASYEFSTIGGNVATNAGGLCCVKYGVTRDALLGLEMVLADGSVQRVGRRTRKGVVGYDLASLVCGSEGTLGIITEITSRLLPEPGPEATLAASFDDLAAAGRAIAEIVRRRQPSMLELMDHASVRAVEEFKPMGLDDDSALLFAGSDSADALGDVEWMGEICAAAGATLVVTTDEAAEGRMLTAARRLAFPALERQGTTLLDDVCVPLDAIPVLIERIEGIAATHKVRIATFGHAGDGNMHPTIVYDDRDEVERTAARRAFEEIVEVALELGGTASGEHGVGVLKHQFLEAELGPALGLSRRIKQALDPENLLNPGRAI